MVWRFSKNILPTRARLVEKKISTDSLCPLCLKEPETNIHALRDCIMVKPVWVLAGFVTLTSWNLAPSTLEWLHDIFSELHTEQISQLLILIWSIWTSRNTYIHGDAAYDGSQKVFARAMVLLESVRAACTPPSAHTLTIRSAKRWCTPLVGLFKVNVDAAIFSHECSFGIGIAIRDHLGGGIAFCSAKRHGKPKQLAAECLAISFALQFATDMIYY